LESEELCITSGEGEQENRDARYLCEWILCCQHESRTYSNIFLIPLIIAICDNISFLICGKITVPPI
jgi:hypothetical protein